jgi:hypothetical protein
MEQEKQNSGEEDENPYANTPIEEMKEPGQGGDDLPG